MSGDLNFLLSSSNQSHALIGGLWVINVIQVAYKHPGLCQTHIRWRCPIRGSPLGLGGRFDLFALNCFDKTWSSKHPTIALLGDNMLRREPIACKVVGQRELRPRSIAPVLKSEVLEIARFS